MAPDSMSPTEDTAYMSLESPMSFSEDICYNVLHEGLKSP